MKRKSMEESGIFVELFMKITNSIFISFSQCSGGWRVRLYEDIVLKWSNSTQMNLHCKQCQLKTFCHIMILHQQLLLRIWLPSWITGLKGRRPIIGRRSRPQVDFLGFQELGQDLSQSLPWGKIAKVRKWKDPLSQSL